MLISTAIVSLYMMLVYVVGADGGGLVWKIVLMGITLFGIIFQAARGRAKGKNFAESLVDDDSEELKEIVEILVEKMTARLPISSDSEE